MHGMHICAFQSAGLRGGFYEKEENKPIWFPSDIEFKRPTHPKSYLNLIPHNTCILQVHFIQVETVDC